MVLNVTEHDAGHAALVECVYTETANAFSHVSEVNLRLLHPARPKNRRHMRINKLAHFGRRDRIHVNRLQPT